MKHRKQRRTLEGQENTLGWVFSAPALFAILIIVLIPLLRSFAQSFQQLDLARPAGNGWIGLGNYFALLKDQRFLNSLWITVRFSLISVLLELLLGLSIALLLNNNFKGRGFVRGLMILPWAMPSIVNAAMWKWIFNADYGALNAFLTQVGLMSAYKVWLSDPFWANALLIMANVWKEAPFTAIMLLAALQTIPTHLYEAGRVDGANGWQRFSRITLPLLMPVMLMVSTLQLIWGFQTFELITVITGGGPFSSTEMVALRVYATTFRSLSFGYGSAMAYLVFLVILIPVIFYTRESYKRIIDY